MHHTAETVYREARCLKAYHRIIGDIALYLLCAVTGEVNDPERLCPFLHVKELCRHEYGGLRLDHLSVEHYRQVKELCVVYLIIFCPAQCLGSAGEVFLGIGPPCTQICARRYACLVAVFNGYLVCCVCNADSALYGMLHHRINGETLRRKGHTAVRHLTEHLCNSAVVGYMNDREFAAPLSRLSYRRG